MQTATFAGYDFPTLMKGYEDDCGITITDGVASTCQWVALALPDAIRIQSEVAQRNRDHFLRVLKQCQAYVDQNRAYLHVDQPATVDGQQVTLNDPVSGVPFSISSARWGAFVSDGDKVLLLHAGYTQAVVVKGCQVAAVIPAITNNGFNVPDRVPKLKD